MTRVFVDTDIIIDFLRTKRGLFPSLLDQQEKGKIKLYVSAITVVELFSGQSAKQNSEKIDQLISVMQVLNLDSELGRVAGGIRRGTKAQIDISDLIVGTSALAIDAELATKNKKHFQKIPKLKFFKI